MSRETPQRRQPTPGAEEMTKWGGERDAVDPEDAGARSIFVTACLPGAFQGPHNVSRVDCDQRIYQYDAPQSPCSSQKRPPQRGDFRHKSKTRAVHERWEGGHEVEVPPRPTFRMRSDDSDATPSQGCYESRVAKLLSHEGPSQSSELGDQERQLARELVFFLWWAVDALFHIIMGVRRVKGCHARWAG